MDILLPYLLIRYQLYMYVLGYVFTFLNGLFLNYLYLSISLHLLILA